MISALNKVKRKLMFTICLYGKEHSGQVLDDLVSELSDAVCSLQT